MNQDEIFTATSFNLLQWISGVACNLPSYWNLQLSETDTETSTDGSLQALKIENAAKDHHCA